MLLEMEPFAQSGHQAAPSPDDTPARPAHPAAEGGIADAFTALEERVLRAVDAVTSERSRRVDAEARCGEAESRRAVADARFAMMESRCAELESRLATFESELANSGPRIAQQQQELVAQREEIALLRAERDRVRERVERMLGQLDALVAGEGTASAVPSPDATLAFEIPLAEQESHPGE